MSMSMSMYTQLDSTRVSRFLFIFFSALSSTGIADYFQHLEAAYMSNLLKALTPTPPGWSQNTHYCQWSGVNCSQPPSSGGPLVNAILLPSSSLSGQLPPDLNSLYYLTHLDLHNNSLTGPIPSLAYLDSLETVYLGHNNFTSIPYDCFQGLTALQTLNLSNNSGLTRWYFPTDLAQSPSLLTLDLAATNVAADLLPAGMFDWFPSLQSVDLSSNYIRGSLPESLGRSRIRHLRLNDNLLWGPIPELSNCTNLTDLQLRNNQLTGLFPPWLMALPSLQNLALDGNYLQGPIPVFSRKGVKATWKENNFCRNDSGPCDPRVTTLHEIAAAFGYPFHLADSWNGNNPCEKGNNWDFIVCKGGEIVTFGIEQWMFGGTVSPAFAKLTSLRELTLSGINLTGTIPQSLTSLSQLELLDLSNNNLSGEVPHFSPKVKLNTTGNVNLVFRGDRDPSPASGHTASGALFKTHKPVWIAVASVLSVGVVILIVIIGKRKRYFSLVQERILRKGRKFLDHNVEDFMLSYNLSVPKRYSYAEVKRITNSFRDKLGQGGYGVVYKASLPHGRHVAVKVISESKGNGEEFINEVASISRTSHVNIVSLLGFCYEINKRALIYEFMPNGSLDKFIYRGGFPSAICNLDWNTLFQIAIGIARGLEYLHQGGTSRILHLDIKPQNILLDEDFCPKISDFGLAKICQKKESIVSMQGTRGTIGYIAPEVFSRTYGGVSHRSDVYSYGMLILEMIGGRKNHDSGGSHTTEMYFPDWIYSDLEQGHTPGNYLAMSEEENDMVRKITMVSLWCIQMNPLDRPPMSKVIEMLQGPLQSVSYPPKATLYSPERPSLQISYTSSSNLFETNSTTLQENDSIKSN